MSERLTVTLKTMQFHARVGILPHERELPQLIEIDISVTCAGETSLSARAAVAGVDYRDLFDIANESVSSGHAELLEQIAQRITERALILPGVRSSRVAVRKPHAAMPGRLDYAEVVLEHETDV